MTGLHFPVFSPSLGKGLVPDSTTAWFLPLMIAAGGILASIIGIFLVRVGEKLEMTALLNALRRGTFATSILAAGLAFLAVWWMDASLNVFWAILVGLATGILIGESTNYFTSYVYKPTLRISEASQTGAGTNIIAGLGNFGGATGLYVTSWAVGARGSYSFAIKIISLAALVGFLLVFLLKRWKAAPEI